ncbi:MAG: CoA transferase [Rhodobacteraceae bacterium]|nr:CoA transferase [Paracoccaceae bacterium]
MTGILKGIRVLDLSRMLSGPYCTMLLADHGAEVIKIEGPEGDTSRRNGPYREDDPNHDWAGYFVSLNRSKKSVMLDLKTAEGKAAFRALAATADVVVENFRPGVMERLGLSYESLAGANPRLVYAAIRGFGDPRSGVSPYQDWPAYDVVAQAMGGLVALTGPDAATPTKVGPGIGDVFAGSLMAFGILAALRAAEATGYGQFVDIAMYDAMISLCERAVYQHDFDGTVPGPEGNGHPLLAPFGIFPARDGHIALGIVDDAFWRKLCEAMGQAGLGTDVRYATRAARCRNAAGVNGIVAEWTAAQSKAGLAAVLGGVVPFGPVNTVADIMADPHVAARGMIAEVPHPDARARGWRVAANPLHFSNNLTPEYATPSAIGGDNRTILAGTEKVPVDTRKLRDSFGAFATGVTVLTSLQGDGTPRGLTANSFTSVSLDPPLLLVCIAKTAHSCETFMTCSHFAVNVLAEDQKAISGLFAGRAPDKFAQCAWSPGLNGVPLIDGALAQFTCVPERSMDAGDHIVIVGRVVEFSQSEGNPLGYFRGNYFSIGIEDRLVSAVAAAEGTRIGAVLTRRGSILLAEDAEGALSVPAVGGVRPSLDALRRQLVSRGLKPDVDFIYAVYEDRETGATGIFYHGEVEGAVPKGMCLLPLEGLPWERIANSAERSMLQRYAEEYRHGVFGVYQGDEITGKVRRVTDR